MLPAILIIVFATSVLSGILGMAGGMVLMAVLVSLLSVSSAMMLHGAVQAAANGSRCWFLRRHVQWRILPPYLAGSALAVAGFAALRLVPDPAVVLLAVGLLPWLARLAPGRQLLSTLDITRPATSMFCGVLVTAAQLLAGASGPLLDLFYLRAPLTRHQVVASKAVTQTLGHVLKLIYYGALLGPSAEQPPWWIFALAMGTAVAGTHVGTRLLDHVPDGTFRRASGAVILMIATACIFKGLWSLFEN
jgi:uncharacterized membrane protein YfcA